MSNSKEIQLLTHAKELVKQYIEYDISDRVATIYTAATECIDGGPCVVTEYEYDGTSSRIIKRKESESTWDATWDI